MKDHHHHHHREGNTIEKTRAVMMKNRQRLGNGGGLSLQAFANAKTRDHNYNPSLIKKQREFYKNAKHVSQYKKLLKQQNEPQNTRPVVLGVTEQEGDETKAARNMEKKKKKKNKQSLETIYENKRQEEEKARLEKEALLRAKKEARERTEAQRKAVKEKMYKKTKSGQPVMKYRIEHLLQSIQASQS